MARPQVTVRPGTRVLLVALPLAAVALSAPFYETLSALPLLHEAWAAVLVAAVLYAMAHLLRAARLAVLAAPALNLHVRTVVLMHFYTAPVSFIVPFKLGELYRWQQLAWLSRKPAGSLLILLLDRMLDAVVLLVVLAVSASLGNPMPGGTAIVSGILALATVIGLFTVFVVPGCLEAVQAYILQNHSAPRARRVLRLVDSTRLTINSARERLRGNIVLLLLMSAAVWVFESSMLAVLARQLNDFGSFLPTLLTRTLFPQATDGPMLAVTSLYVLTCLLTLLPIWVVATSLYLLRIRAPRRNVPFAQPSPSARRTRRLHLRASAKTL